MAQIVAIGMAVIAGLLHSIAHEWGHFAGALEWFESCAEKPYKYFFMFNLTLRLTMPDRLCG